MNLQQVLTLLAALARASAYASGQHPAGQLASGTVNIAVYLTPAECEAVQQLAAACPPGAPPGDAAPVVYAEPAGGEEVLR